MSEALIPSLGILVYQALGVGVIGLDSKCRIILWNNWMENHSDIKRSHILGKDIFKQFPSIKDKKQDRYILRSLEKRIPCLLTPLLHEAFIPLEIRKGHEKIPMRQNVKILPVTGMEDETEVMIVIEDFTEQILHEAEILRLNRVLKGIRNVNQLITQVDSEDELLTGACKILVDDIGYTFSWVGFIEEGSIDIKPSAFAGIEREAINGLVVKCDESEYGNGVTGRAIKTGKIQVVQDIQEDPMSGPWREFARRTGYQSTCSLPLRADDRVIGALNVHSQLKGVFHGEELELL
ncbi:MAG: GAF domain-containing protein, partial [Deltaproteobacteria bacterium]|nr:GAF domain-containing protein [Deltaproteobacteria bacterium]